MMKRRNFLQLTGSTLTALGMSHLDIINQGNHYAKVLAENAPRKLALLVGITKYPEHERITSELHGCVNDVRMQQELLIHRFGFDPENIVALHSEQTQAKFQPTRNNILYYFEKHLIEKAEPGSVVVFHFSGHGSQLLDPESIANCSNEELTFTDLNSSLVVLDDSRKNLAADIMGRTLFLLRLELQRKTKNVMMVLDCCHSGGGTRGNTIIRSASSDIPAKEEINYQEDLMRKLGIDKNKLYKLRCQGDTGIVVAAAKGEQLAKDKSFDQDFNAGVFTYLLTQYLWQKTNTIGNTILEIQNLFRQGISKQTPIIDADKNKPFYFIDNPSVISSDGIISQIEGKNISLWLGGIDYHNLPSIQNQATFAIIDSQQQTLAKLKLISRKGLVAKAQIVENYANTSIKSGMFIQEVSRVIPAHLKLNIGLDPSLTKDIGDAIKKLAQINRMEPIPAQADTLYSKKVEYILGRMTKENRKKQTNREDLPDIDTIGLFSESLEFIPGSFGKQGESIANAISRLKPKLISFLAMYLLKQTLNVNSSKLDVEASISLLEQPNTIIAKTQTQTSREKSNQIQGKETYSRILPLNKLFQFEIKNNMAENLYVIVILIDVTGKPYVVYPYQNIIKSKTLQIKPNEPLIVGKRGQIELKAVEKGSAEVLIVTSRSELKNAAKMLQQLVRETRGGGGRGEANEPIDISRGEPVTVIDNLLDDLSGSRSGNGQPREVKAENIATLSMSFEVG
jgi:Caspase domain